ncbi:MAG: M23 family metallopeptidase [Lachnospiraceae bacterium]|jgi:murein DD-endopeptidase MepM/ murein hydrolase activator NlpD|nr:M23 family metallopeptidase [Lachnospiraceae bacterium]
MKISKQAILQGVKQFLCIPYIYISHGFKLPHGNYCTKVQYMLPFEGEWTVINGGCDKEFSHSWKIPTQRYAYDFVIMDNNGKTHHGHNDKLTSYACYGNNVLAPADGMVIAIGNICDDEKPFGDEIIEMTAKDVRGNFILIKHAEKEYGFIGHLQPQSIIVEIGQRVNQGEIIAKCGNSGNSSEPHIHFHLQDGINFFTSAGIPITFHNICISKKQGYENYDKRKISDLKKSTSTKTKIHRGQQVSNIHNLLK